MSYDDESIDAQSREISGQLQKGTQIPRDMMLLKMENESIMALAQTKPRNPAEVVKQLQAVIDAYPAAADDAIYCKPVGTVYVIQCGDCPKRYEVAWKDKDKAHCPACDSQKKKSTRKETKFAENLSIRAAETVRSIYGFNRLATTSEEIEDGKVRISGTFIDYAAGTMTSDERIVSPWYKSKYNGMQRIEEDRFLNLTVKSEKAKLRRDIILDAVPAIVKAAFRDACEKKIAETVTPEVIEATVLPYFASQGLTADHLDALVGTPRRMGWTNSHLLFLRKLAAGLKNGEFTPESLREKASDDPEPTATTQPKQETTPGATTEADLTNPKKKRETKKKEDSPQEAATETTEPVTQPADGELFPQEPMPEDKFLNWEAMIAEAENRKQLEDFVAGVKREKMSKEQIAAIGGLIVKRRGELRENTK